MCGLFGFLCDFPQHVQGARASTCNNVVRRWVIMAKNWKSVTVPYTIKNDSPKRSTPKVFKEGCFTKTIMIIIHKQFATKNIIKAEFRNSASLFFSSVLASNPANSGIKHSCRKLSQKWYSIASSSSFLGSKVSVGSLSNCRRAQRFFFWPARENVWN